MTDTKKDSVETETLFLHKCRINLLQNRLLQKKHSSSLFLPALEPPLIISFGSTWHCIQMFIHHQIHFCSQMFLEQHITQEVTSRKYAVECHCSTQKCSVFCLSCWVVRHRFFSLALYNQKFLYFRNRPITFSHNANCISQALFNYFNIFCSTKQSQLNTQILTWMQNHSLSHPYWFTTYISSAK
jgi:hypothetical protein